MSSVSNIIRTTAHTVLSNRSATSSASEELQNLFGKLHMDAIASVGAGTASSTGTTAAASAATDSVSSSASASTGSDTTGLISGLRHLFDGALNTAKDARATAKAVTAYSHGAGLAGLAATAVSKLA
jgi:hypothetical protein